MTTERTKRPWFLLLLVLALLAAACGGGDTDTGGEQASPGEEAPGEEPEAPATDGAAAGNGDTFTMAVPGIAGSLDPSVFEGDPTSELAPHYSGALMRFSQPAEGEMPGYDEVEPFIAEDYTRNDDGSYTFTLREVESPYGNRLTSEDVQWSLERLIELDPIGRFLMTVARVDVEQPVEIIDDRTFTLRVTEPSIFLLPAMTWFSTSPLDSTEAKAHATDDDPWAQEWLASNSASFGPYYVESFTPSREIQLAVNPGWTGEQPDLTRVVLRAVPESSTRLQVIQTGEADYVNHLQYDHLAALQNVDGVRLEPTSATVDALALNLAFEPFADERVRRAISMAIDREAVVQGPYQGFGEPALWQVSSKIPQPELPEPIAYDPEAARALLAEAGYGDGFAFTLTVSPGRPGPHVEPLAALLQSQLAEIGLEVSIDVIPGAAEFQQAMRDGALEAYVSIQRPIVLDVAYSTFLVHGTGGAINDHGYSNERVDELIALMLTTDPGPERDEYSRELHQILMDTTPWVPLVEVVNAQAFRENIANYHAYPNNILYLYELVKE